MSRRKSQPRSTAAEIEGRCTFAVLADIDPFGGGSHQWALNILYALDDYRASRGDISVSILHYRNYSGGHPLAGIFPEFSFVRMGKLANLMARIFRRATVIAPVLLPLLRPLFPLNIAAARCHADVVLFPVTVLDSLLCNRPNIFCMADIAHVYYPHFPEVREGNGLRMRDVLFRYGLANADVVMVETAQLRNEIAKHYGADPGRAHVVFQVLPRLFNMSEHPDAATEIPEPYLFYPAQLWAHKNHVNLLKAFSELSVEFPNLTLVFSGSRKPGDEVIFDRIKELRLENRVQYLGYVPDARMPQLYRNAEALVMPSYFGPTNIPTLEAFAFGCPAIISDLPGVLEQVGDAALRFNPDDATDIAAKIRQVLIDPALAEQLIIAGKARIKELSYENFRIQMFNLFRAAAYPRK
jgi:glycosyltransferase involved in cell wall biosynthesis